MNVSNIEIVEIVFDARDEGRREIKGELREHIEELINDRKSKRDTSDEDSPLRDNYVGQIEALKEILDWTKN